MTTVEFATVATAVYAAVVSTVVLVWDVVKWRMSGPRLRLTVQTRLALLGNGQLDTTTCLGVQVTNYGDSPTTLMSFGALMYKNDWLALVQADRPEFGLVFPEGPGVPILPRVLEPGQQWLGLVPRADLIESDRP
jgi:hypothetical protein